VAQVMIAMPRCMTAAGLREVHRNDVGFSHKIVMSALRRQS